jgi:hypothetical protein
MNIGMISSIKYKIIESIYICSHYHKAFNKKLSGELIIRLDDKFSIEMQIFTPLVYHEHKENQNE